jgi:hypothetical protein
VAVIEKKGLVVPLLGACSIRIVALALIVEFKLRPLT